MSTHVCLNCYKLASYKCSCCQVAHYCSKACQTKDYGIHKYEVVVDNTMSYGRSTGDMEVEGDKPQMLPRRIVKVKDSVKVHVAEVNDTMARLREYLGRLKPSDPEMMEDNSPETQALRQAFMDQLMEKGERTTLRKEMAQLYALEDMARIFGKTYDPAAIMSGFYAHFLRSKRALSLATAEAYIKSDKAELTRLFGEMDKLIEYYREEVFDKWLLVDLRVGESGTIDDPDYQEGFEVLPFYKEEILKAQKTKLKDHMDGILDAMYERTVSKTEKFYRNRRRQKKAEESNKRSTSYDEGLDLDEENGKRRKSFRETWSLNGKEKGDKKDSDGMDVEDKKANVVTKKKVAVTPKASAATKKTVTPKASVATKKVAVTPKASTATKKKNTKEYEEEPLLLGIQQRDIYKESDDMIMNDTLDRLELEIGDDSEADRRESLIVKNVHSNYIQQQAESFKAQIEKTSAIFIENGKISINSDNSKAVIDYMSNGVNEGFEERSMTRSIFLDRDLKAGATGLAYALGGTAIILSSAFFIGGISNLFNVRPSLSELQKSGERLVGVADNFIGDTEKELLQLNLGVKQEIDKWLLHKDLYQFASSQDLHLTLTRLESTGVDALSVTDTNFITSMKSSFVILKNHLKSEVKRFEADKANDMAFYAHKTITAFDNFASNGNVKDLREAVEGFNYKKEYLFPYADASLIGTFANIGSYLDQYTLRMTRFIDKFRTEIADSRTDFNANVIIVKEGIDKLKLIEAPMVHSFMDYTGVGKGYALHPGVQQGLDELTWLNRPGRPFISRTLTQAASIEMTSKDVFNSLNPWGIANLSVNDGIMSLIRLGDFQNMIRIVMGTATGMGLLLKGIIKLPGYLGGCALWIRDRISPLNETAKKERQTEATEKIYIEIYAIMTDPRRPPMQAQRDAILLLRSIGTEGSTAELMACVDNIKTQHQYKRVKNKAQVLVEHIDKFADNLLLVKDSRYLNYAMELFNIAKVVSNGLEIINTFCYIGSWLVTTASYMWSMIGFETIKSAIVVGAQTAYEAVASEPFAYLISAAIIGLIATIYIKKETFIKNTPECVQAPLRFYLRSLRTSPFFTLGATHTILKGLSAIFNVCTPMAGQLLFSSLSNVLENFGVSGEDQTKYVGALDEYSKNLTNLQSLAIKLDETPGASQTLKNIVTGIYENKENGIDNLSKHILDISYRLQTRNNIGDVFPKS